MMCSQSPLTFGSVTRSPTARLQVPNPVPEVWLFVARTPTWLDYPLII